MTESDVAWIKCYGGDSLKQWLDMNQNDFRSIGPSLPLTDQELERLGGSCMSGHEGCHSHGKSCESRLDKQEVKSPNRVRMATCHEPSS